jgi:hypothetical protein
VRREMPAWPVFSPALEDSASRPEFECLSVMQPKVAARKIGGQAGVPFHLCRREVPRDRARFRSTSHHCAALRGDRRGAPPCHFQAQSRDVVRFRRRPLRFSVRSHPESHPGANGGVGFGGPEPTSLERIGGEIRREW